MSKERFLKDVANHVMEVHRDDGLYRHVRFRKPGTMCMHFDLITWPGYLCYTGDMGTYVFTRLADMFKFFRPDQDSRRDPLDWIDRRYWAEKVVSGDRHDGTREFDPEAFKREITEQRRKLFVENFREVDTDQRRDFWESLQEVIDCADDGESFTFAAVRDWSFVIRSKPRDFADHFLRSGETIHLDTDDFPDCKRDTHRFVWCCYALRWGIGMYDQAKASDDVKELPGGKNNV